MRSTHWASSWLGHRSAMATVNMILEMARQFAEEGFPNPMAARVISITTRTIRIVFVAAAAVNSHNEKALGRHDSIIICQWLTCSKETKNEGREDGRATGFWRRSDELIAMPLKFQDIYDCNFKLQCMHDVRTLDSRISQS